MTVVCMDCKKRIREKCPKCGSDALPYQEWTENGVTLHRAVCRNRNCEHSFLVGGSAVSHGLCDPCFSKRMDTAPMGVRV